MRCKSVTLLGFLLGCGCASPRPEPAHAGHAAQAGAEPGAAVLATEPAPQSTLAEADELYRSQLGASRAGQFEVDRQVAEIRRAILLYEQFLERAGDDPEYAVAVKRSREALADLRDTLVFLAQPAAPTPAPSP